MGVTTRGDRKRQAQQGQGMTTNNSTVSSASSATIAATATGGDEAAGGRGRGAMTATKPKNGTSRSKAPQPRTNTRGGGRKPSSTAASTSAGEVANLDDLPILTPDDLQLLSEEDTKATLQTFFERHGIGNIFDPIPRNQEESLSAHFLLEKSDIKALFKLLVPGHSDRSTTFLKLLDNVRKAAFSASSLAGIPPGEKPDTLDNVSLLATFTAVCGVPSTSGNDWKQEHFKEGIRRQIDSERKGEDYHYKGSSNVELARRLEALGEKSHFQLRWRLVREVWRAENPGRNMDYTPNPLRVRNTPVNVPATPAPSISGSIGSDVNANAAVVVPPTPIQGNQQNGNAVAPPPVDTNLLLTMLMEQQRRNEEERRRNEEDMKEERRRNDEERRRNDEERLRNDDKFQAQSNQMVEQNNKFASLQQTNTMLLKEIADNVKPRLNTLETNQAGMRTEISGLQANHATLETNQAGMRTEIDDQKEKIDFLLKSVKKSRGRYSFGDTPDSKGGTSDDDEVKDSFIPKVLDFSEGNTPTGKVSADPAPERLKFALIEAFCKDERFDFLREQLQQTTSLSTDTLEGILPEMLRVCGCSEYCLEFRFELMALLPSAAGVLGRNFQRFLLDALCMFESLMEKFNEDDTELEMKNLLLKSYTKLIHSLDAVLALMIAELEDEQKDNGVHHIKDGILHLTSKMTQPVTLAVPGEREFVEADKAREFVALWTEQLTAHRRTVRTILAGNVLEKALWKNVVLCDQIRLSGKSFSAEAAEIIAAFLNDPAFMGGPSVASGILCAQLADIIAGRPTDVGLLVLQTICDAFADAELVDVNLSDNAIGQQGIVACKTVLSPSLERLALCNNGLSEDTMKEVVDTLIRSGCVANLTKVHFYNNMSGEEGCNEFARILDKSSKLTDVRFSSTRAGKAGSDIVAKALDAALEEGRNTGLEKLDLCDNFFSSETSQAALASVIARAPITYLNLGSCELGNDGVNKICLALVNHNSSLEHLDLSGNEVDIHGVEHIAGYIQNSGGKLNCLYLGYNELGDDGARKICLAIVNHNSSLEDLDLSHSNMGAIGARALIDAASAGKLPNLKKISLDGNYFKEDIVGELQVAFGDKLGEMEDNDSDGEGHDDLADDDSDEEADDADVPDVDSDSDLVDRMSRLSMMSS